MKPIRIILSSLIVIAITSCNDRTENETEGNVSRDPVIHSKSEALDNMEVRSNSVTGLQYRCYCNERYGYCIDYPLEVLYPQGESGSGDGQVFTSADSQDTLLVYRDFSDMSDPDTKFTLKAEYEHDIADQGNDRGKRITYKKSGKDFFVLSGYRGDKIFYQKTMLSNGQLITCILSYRKSEKEIYKQISERVFQSFK